MGEQDMPLRTIQDLEAIEHVPSALRLIVRSTYELIREAATKDPERRAITLLAEGVRSDRPARLSYRALLNGMHQTANLLADLGIEPTDVIALLLPQLQETHLLLWGGQAAGIVCPISPWFPSEQIVALLQAAKAKLLVAPGPQVSHDLWQKAEAVRREVKSITHLLQVRGPGKERDGVYAYDALLVDYQASRLHTEREIAPDDIAVSFPIRDTAGTPRLVPVTHGNLLDASWAISKVLMLAPEEVLLRSLPRFMQAYW
jgi:fatty-acyl-CoA synthase